MVQRQKLADMAASKVPDLNIPSERATKELQNACFNFEIGHSKLKLWPLKDTAKIGQKPKANVHGAKAKIGQFGLVKFSLFKHTVW